MGVASNLLTFSLLRVKNWQTLYNYKCTLKCTSKYGDDVIHKQMRRRRQLIHKQTSHNSLPRQVLHVPIRPPYNSVSMRSTHDTCLCARLDIYQTVRRSVHIDVGLAYLRRMSMGCYSCQRIICKAHSSACTHLRDDLKARKNFPQTYNGHRRSHLKQASRWCCAHVFY